MLIRCLVGLSTGLMISLSAFADVYPTTPIKTVTPGALCQEPDSHRYAEQINYCERDVDSKMKKAVIKLYMAEMPGFAITVETRHEYKIDHFIPLCMGGANKIENLWPQHMSVYRYTDIIELNLCIDLEAGNITQAQAVAKMRFAKFHITELAQYENPVDRMNYITENFEKAENQ